MSAAALGISRTVRIAEAVLWIGAGLLILGVHVGAAAWLLREPPIVPADDQPPAAIMIELADEAEAELTEMNDITPDRQVAQESTASIAQDALDEPPEEEIEEIAEPEEPVEEEVPEEATTEPLEKVEVPLPVAQPRPPEKKKPEKKEKPKKKPVPQKSAASAASKAAIEAQVQVKQSNRTAARQTASGVNVSASPARWQARLMAHLEKRKRYPPGARSRGERGIVYVRFTIDDAGNVLSASLARSSGFSELDGEVLSLVRRASPVPAPPPGAKKTITAPVRFSVR